MGVVRLAFGAELRRRWRSWLAIAILISVVGGLVLCAAAAGRRTESAFPRFVAAHGFDVVEYGTVPAPRFAMLPGVTSAAEFVSPDIGQPTCNCTHAINPTDLSVGVLSPNEISPFTLVSGRMPAASAPDEVLASSTLRQDVGLRLGSVIRVPFYARSQASAYNDATGAPPKPTGPTIPLRVVGFEATEYEFPSGGTPSYDIYATPAFARTVIPRTAVDYVYFIRLRHGAADLPRFDAAANALRVTGVQGFQNEDQAIESVEASIHPQVIGWWILAALAGLVALAVVGQALARQSIVEGEDFPTMTALGTDGRQLVALGMARNLVVALAGAAGAVVVAVALSPIAPIGEARTAESSTGIAFDTQILLLGALTTVVLVLALGVWPALRSVHTLRSDRPVASRPSAMVGHLAALGAPPTAVIGVRNALERRNGGEPVPVGSAILGTVLAVIALCGTAVFGASLSHLTATPRLYGDTFQLSFSDVNAGGSDLALLRSLEHDPAVTAISGAFAPPPISINKVAVTDVAFAPIRGRLLLSTVNGHLPIGNRQIGLGATTMHQVGAHVGSAVKVTVSLPSGGKRTLPFRVVSQISFPVLGGGIVSLGNGAAFTVSGYVAAACPTGPRQSACRRSLEQTNQGGLIVSFLSGPRGEAAIEHYLGAYRSFAALPITPTSLINFGEAVNFPLIFGAMLALFGLATLLHLLVVSVSRRRREVGLLKVVGFVNGQVASAVGWQATTLALVGIVIGVPVGVVLGRAVWRTFANNLGVVPVAVVPIWLIAVLVAGVLVAANLVAIAPALMATRSRPGDLLRTS